jgi:hypothetical protein
MSFGSIEVPPIGYIELDGRLGGAHTNAITREWRPCLRTYLHRTSETGDAQVHAPLLRLSIDCEQAGTRRHHLHLPPELLGYL